MNLFWNKIMKFSLHIISCWMLPGWNFHANAGKCYLSKFWDDDDDDDDDNDDNFVVWLTVERHLALFPAGIIVTDSRYHESPTCRK